MKRFVQGRQNPKAGPEQILNQSKKLEKQESTGLRENIPASGSHRETEKIETTVHSGIEIKTISRPVTYMC